MQSPPWIETHLDFGVFWVAMSFLKRLAFPVLIAVLCFGCKSSDPNLSTGSIAGVVIKGNTPGQINRGVEQVFAKHGYKLITSGPMTSVLEKKGSTGTNLAYGNWMGTPVMIRVKTRIIKVDEAVFRLECSAARVRDAGTMMDEEIKIGKMKGGAFQKLLEEVKTSLAGTGFDLESQGQRPN